MAIKRNWHWREARSIEGLRKPGKLSPAVWYFEAGNADRPRPWVLRDITGVIGTYKTEESCRRAAERHADLLWSEEVPDPKRYRLKTHTGDDFSQPLIVVDCDEVSAKALLPRFIADAPNSTECRELNPDGTTSGFAIVAFG